MSCRSYLSIRRCSGFAVVFAEDVPDVPSQDKPPGTLLSRLCPSLLIETCLVFQLLGINFAPLTINSIKLAHTHNCSCFDGGHLRSLTRLCVESETNWTFFSFGVVIFRIIKSALSLPHHSFVNSWFSIPYRTWTLGQFYSFSSFSH